jgi:hypothetical protein
MLLLLVPTLSMVCDSKLTVEILIHAKSGLLELNLLISRAMPMTELLNQLPNIALDDLNGLQATRWGKRLPVDAMVFPGDQIAWLKPVQFDPNLSRQARVNKQRLESKRLKLEAYRAASLKRAQRS